MYASYTSDSTIAVTSCRADFIKAARNPTYSGAIYDRTHPSAREDITRVLSTMGYNDLLEYRNYGLRIQIAPHHNGNRTVLMESRLPPALCNLIENRAKLMADITGSQNFRLTMGNLRHEKMHDHIIPTMTGSLINLGTQWQINDKENIRTGQVNQGDDFFMRPYLQHRSTPITENEERFTWAITTYVL